MNILERHRLKKQQRALMQKRDIYERLQTERSEDAHFYKCVQRKMDALDEQAEHMRRILEGRSDE